MIIINAYFDQINIDVTKGFYKAIGSGSGRKVFDLENGNVVKVAKNKKGFAQNEAEYQISSIDSSNIYAKVILISDDFKFLTMKKAERLNDFSYVRNYYNVTSNRELFRIDQIRKFYVDNDLLLPDLYRIANWGIINGKPVLIDYGFTKKVKHKYYSRF